MESEIWTVTPEKISRVINEPDWSSKSDFEKAELIRMWLESSVPSYLGERFVYRVSALGTRTEDGRELFVVETGTPDEFT